MNRRNYQKELDALIRQNQAQQQTKKLLLHSCCAPCSSYVLEYLSAFFEITVYYYNPNIYPPEEFAVRSEEQERLIDRMTPVNPISFRAGIYDPDEFYQCVRGLEDLPEGSRRCFACYELRLREAARIAQAEHFDYFTTTLSVSPLKHADKINEIGERLAAEYQITHLPSDFKKKNGYRRSVELSAEFGLYRQDYCGCIFSVRS